MSKRTLTSLTTLLALTACGDESSTPTTEDAVSEYIEITGLAITSEDPVSLLHPLKVNVTAELHGEPWVADVVVGLRSQDRAAGCVLGAMLAEHDSPSSSAWINEAEFFVNLDCAELVGRDDIELFVGFDPFDELGDGLPDATQTPTSAIEFDAFSIVHAAAVSLAACEDCGTPLELHPSPGLDAQIREANLSSTVAVLSVANSETSEPAAPSGRPDLMLTSMARVTGLVRGRDLDDDQVHLVHHIRPQGSSDLGLPLTARNADTALERAEVPFSDSSPVTSISALFFEGQTRDALAEGVWSNVEEFELVSCLEAEFEQAVYPGELEPRANDCSVLPVYVVREVVGQEAIPASGNINTADVYQQNWPAGSSHSAFGSTGVNLKAWLDVNGSDAMTQTYKGIRVHSAGSWYEAGVDAYASVFGHYADLVDIYATFLAYDFGGGGVAMGASVFGLDFISPFEIQLADGVPLTLQQMFDASGLDLEPSLTTSVTVAGVSFDDGCDTVTANVKVQGTVGINPSQTSITASSTQQGTELSGTITPYFNLAVVATASFDFWGIVSGGISSTLNLITLSLPFTVSAELVNYDGLDASRLELSESANAAINLLSGAITMWVEYDFVVYSDVHSFTIASWNGWNFNLPMFSASQVLTFGSEKPSTNWCGHAAAELFTGDFDGDGESDYLCHDNVDGRKWIDHHDNGFGGTDFYRAAQWCFGANHQVHVGDFNGDGRDDMLCHAPTRKSIDYADANGELWGTDWYKDLAWCTHAGARLKVEDINGDGRDDIRCVDTGGNQWIDYADSNGQFHGTDWNGTAAPGGFCDQYDGETIALQTPHGRYIGLGLSPLLTYIATQTTSISNGEWDVDCIGEEVWLRRSIPYLGSYSLAAQNSFWGYNVATIGDVTWTPQLQSDGKWAFQSGYNRFLSAASSAYNYDVKQQTYVGGWEKFTVVPL